jgi:hypothetical protein
MEEDYSNDEEDHAQEDDKYKLHHYVGQHKYRFLLQINRGNNHFSVPNGKM